MLSYYNNIILLSILAFAGTYCVSQCLPLSYGQVEFNTDEPITQSDNSTTNETATDTNGPVILSSGIFTDSSGSSIKGEVLNNLTIPIQFVQISATVYDQNGKVQSTGFTYSDLGNMRAGEKSGFSISLDSKIPKNAKYSLNTDYQEGTDVPACLKLDVGRHSKDISGTFKVVGEVTNQCTDVATFVKVSGIFYDKDHKVIDTSFTYTNPSDIKPNKKSPFDLSLFSNTGKIKTISLNVESNEFAMVK